MIRSELGLIFKCFHSVLLVTAPELTFPIARLFRPILLELVSRIVEKDVVYRCNPDSMSRLESQELIASCLSKLLPTCPFLCR